MQVLCSQLSMYDACGANESKSEMRVIKIKKAIITSSNNTDEEGDVGKKADTQKRGIRPRKLV